MIHKVVLLEDLSIQCCDKKWAEDQVDAKHQIDIEGVEHLTKNSDGSTDAWIEFPDRNPDWYAATLCNRCENIVLWGLINRLVLRTGLL